MYAVACGEMFDAINFFGPFEDWDTACEWAEHNAEYNYWVVKLESIDF